MGIMDKSATKKEFDNYKKETSKQLSYLKKEITSKVTHNERWIRDTVTRVKEIYENALKYETEIKNRSEVGNKILTELKSNKNTLFTEIEEAKDYKQSVLDTESEINNASSNIHKRIKVINEALETAEKLPGDIEYVKNLIEESKNTNEDIKAFKNHSADKKSEIDTLYNDVYGQDIQNDNGEVEHTDGIKDKLKKAYDDLSSKIEKLDDLLKESIKSSSKEFEKLLTKASISYESIDKKIKSLLPGAMASGLSSAYEKKTKDEKVSQKELEKNFKHSLIGLVLVSLIPVGVDIYRLVVLNNTLLEVIKDTPSLIMSILPIYFPILWFAHSSSKKLNLSKRLIEEYTHKAVLGNTFEGLSTQIESLSTDDSIRDELRVKLLFNLLQVSSENPGKLITEYQASDHPLMEALENSSKLSSSIDILNNIPGFSAIVKKLSKKQDKILKEANKQVKSGLSKHGEINDKDNKND